MQSDEEDQEKLIVHGPEFVASTRFGTMAYAPTTDGSGQYTVQKFAAPGELTELQRTGIEAAVAKAKSNPCPVVLPVMANLDDNGMSWVAWESNNRPTVAKLLSDFERRISRKAMNLDNLSNLFHQIAEALDACQDAGWHSPEVDLALDRIYVAFESDPSPSELWKSPDTETWPPFEIRMLPFSLDYWFPVSPSPSWHEYPFPIRFAGLIYGTLGGKVDKDGVPRLEDYRAGLTAMGQGANTYLRTTLLTPKEQMAGLAGSQVTDWYTKLLKAEGLLERSGIFLVQKKAPVVPQPAQPLEATEPTPTKGGKKGFVWAGVGGAVAVGLLVFFLRPPSTPVGSFEEVLAQAAQFNELGDSKQAVNFLLFAAADISETPEQKAQALEMAFGMRSVEAAAALADLESATSPSSAANRLMAAAEWLRNNTPVVTVNRSLTEKEALSAAGVLGSGEAHWQLGVLLLRDNSKAEAQASLFKAAEIFTNGNATTLAAPDRAAEIHESLFRDFGQRTSLDWLIAFHRSPAPEKAAALAEEGGDFKQASALYLEASQFDKAAAVSIQGSDFDSAESAFLMAGQPDMAVAMWEQQGQIESAAKVWLKTEPKDEKKAAEFLIGRATKSEPARAIQLLGSPLLQGNVDALFRLAKLQETAGSLDAAKRSYSRFLSTMPRDRTTWPAEWAAWRQEVLAWQQINDPAAIDESFIKEKIAAGEFKEAADLYERAGRLDDAADVLINHAKDDDQAAALFQRADLPEKAAEIWEKGGSFEKVADMWLKRGDLPRAGAYALKKGKEVAGSDATKALALLDTAVGSGELEGHYFIGNLQEGKDDSAALVNYCAFASKLVAVPQAQWRPDWGSFRTQALDRISDRGGAEWVVHLYNLAQEPGEDAINLLKKDPKRVDVAASALVQLGRVPEAADSYVEAGQKEKGIDLLIQTAGALPVERKEALYEKAVSLGDPEGHYHIGLIDEETRQNLPEAALRYKKFYDDLGSRSRSAWKGNWAALRQDATNRGYKIDPVLFGDSVLKELAKSLPLEEGVRGLLEKGKVKIAGELYVEAEMPDLAVKLYRGGKLYEDAALLLVSLKRVDEAADVWVEAGDPGRAQTLLIEEGKASDNPEIATTLFDKAVALGNPEGHYHIGSIIEEAGNNPTGAAGRYVTFLKALNPIPANTWSPAWAEMRTQAFEKVKMIGDAPSLELLAEQVTDAEASQDLLWESSRIWLTGNQVTQPDPARADAALLKAAKVGHPIANKSLGDKAAEAGMWPSALEFFLGAATNPLADAAPADKKSAKSEAAEAAGDLYLGSGDAAKPGITTDENRAIELYRIASDGGLPSAMVKLAELLAGTKREDFAGALRYFEAASGAGDGYASLRAALIYANGTGVDKDIPKAQDLIQRAIQQGNKNAERFEKIIK